MGLTESNSNKSKIQQHYKLIRRYTSECYGDLTVVQHKETKQLFALKQIITQNPQLTHLVQKRYQLQHKNLVALQKYVFIGDQSLCSNLKNIQLLYNYYPTNLDEEIQQRVDNGESFSDLEISKIIIDVIDCLKYLQGHNIVHLMTSMKSLLYDSAHKMVKIVENQDIMLYSKNQEVNIMNFILNKKMLPLHPKIQPKDCSDTSMSRDKIIFQNIFVLGLVALGLCFMREPIQLGIFGKTCYNFQKIKKRVTQIRQKFPKTHHIVSVMTRESEQYKGYGQLISQLSEEHKFTNKQNDRGLRLTDIQPLQKSDLFKKNTKLSKLRELKRYNNSITQQF